MSSRGAYTRRDSLKWAALVPSSSLVGLGCGDAGEPAATTLDAGSTADAAVDRLCIVRPEQTEGPFFLDEGLVRSDIRIDPTDGSVTPGVPLVLSLRVLGLTSNGCEPLPGAFYDLWQCDARGVYSDVSRATADSRGRKFLRGQQRTDSDGAVTFTTIYPGFYPGRAVHVHIKVRVPAFAGRPAQSFTSQLYFPDAVTDVVHARPPYDGRSERRRRNEEDGIFLADGGRELLLDPSPAGEAYVASFALALRLL